MTEDCMKGPFAPDAPLQRSYDGRPPKAADEPGRATAEEATLAAMYAEASLEPATAEETDAERLVVIDR